MVDNSNARASSPRKLTWYVVTALAIVAIVLLNRDEKIVDNYSEDSLKPETSAGSLTPTTHPPIRQISILGERNSGTRWTFSHLGSCFNHTLPVKRDLTRYKHWFQYKNYTKYPHDTLVIAQFRNPYDWLEAMRNVPHHSPAHMFMEWEKFLSKEWTTERIGIDLNTSKDAKCQCDFDYKDIISCAITPLAKEAYDHKLHFSEDQPFYEMRNDGSGKPYKNIMEMRSDKIRNFHDVKEYDGIADVWTVQYEYLLSKGTKHMLDKIAEWTGVPYRCDPYPPQNRRRRPLSKAYAEYVNKHLDWTAEGLVGYVQEWPKDELETTEASPGN